MKIALFVFGGILCGVIGFWIGMIWLANSIRKNM